MFGKFLIVCACMLISPAVFAQPVTTNPGAGTEWAVEEVVVRAPAPRVWKLTRGDSSVYVIGTVEPLSKNVSWNAEQIKDLIAHSNRLILPPHSTLSLFDGIDVYLHMHRTSGDLDSELPEALRLRLHALLTRLGRSPQSLNNDKAAWAALQLLRDLRASGPVSDDEPERTMTQAARDHDVPIIYAGQYDAKPMLIELTKIPEAEGQVLLEKAIAGAQWQLDHSEAITKAWADGNLKSLRENEGPSASMNAILKATAAAQDIGAKSELDIPAAINAALAEPGVSVAILDLNKFARKGGAIDMLRKDGVQIVEPEE